VVEMTEKIKVSRVVWAIYVHHTQYVVSCETREDAMKFVELFYKNTAWHLEPRAIYEVINE